MNLNFENNKFWELALNFRWPHEGIMVGYEIIPPESLINYYTVKIHLTFFTVIIEWGEI